MVTEPEETTPELGKAIKDYLQWVAFTNKLITMEGGGSFALGEGERRHREEGKQTLLRRITKLAKGAQTNDNAEKTAKARP